MADLGEQEVKEIDKQLALTHKYYLDDRPKGEILLTNQLVRTLSEINFNTLKKSPVSNPKGTTIRKQDFLYVCLPGVPPFQQEFKFLNLPGECLYFNFSCFQKGLSEAQLSEMATQFDEQAKTLQLRINQISATKPIVFVYHSYGTYTLASYCRQFGGNRIIGFIDAGGAPIRFYYAIRQGLRYQSKTPFAMIKQNLDQYFKTFTERNRKFGITPYQNKYQMLGICRSVQLGSGLRETFELLRNLPKVLKCFIFGRKDAIFPEDTINEKVAHYCYTNKLEEQYEQHMQKVFRRRFGLECTSIQEKFIFSIGEGHHSIHMSKKHKQTVSAIVRYYLDFIEQAHSKEEAKL